MINYFSILLFCTALWVGNSGVFKNSDNAPIKAKKTTTKKIGEEILSIRILSQTKAISVLINPQVGKYQVTVDGHSFIELDNQTVYWKLKAVLIDLPG